MRSAILGLSVLCAATTLAGDGVSERAKVLHFSSIVLDTHDDTTQLMLDPGFDLGARHDFGSVDIPRMKEGGMNALFFSIFLPSSVTGSDAVEKAVIQIDTIREAVKKHPSDLMLATTANEVREAHKQGKIAALMGLEGGHMLAGDLAVLRSFAALGVRYVTLTHSGNDEWADSSTDKPVHNGLTEFGKEVVREMNRLGVMVDVSHVSDKTFYDALDVSKAPLIASHSSCRELCNIPRNMTDEMIKALAAKGGVIQINYGVGFLSQKYHDAELIAAQSWLRTESGAEMKKRCGDGATASCYIREGERVLRGYVATGRLPRVDHNAIVEHIDHVAKLVGADHVGLGSDFDGAFVPFGMEDCSKLPKITEALMRKGYSDDDIRKILGGNLLRVMEQNEKVSRELQARSEQQSQYGERFRE